MILETCNGLFVEIDDEDFPKLLRREVYLTNGYPSITVNYRCLYVHRIVCGAKTGQYVDHVDGNVLNCKKSNLRICTNSQNLMNRGKPVNNTSGYKGVSKQSGRNKYTAQIVVDQKNIFLGSFSDPKEAHLAYERAAEKYFGEFFIRRNNGNP